MKSIEDITLAITDLCKLDSESEYASLKWLYPTNDDTYPPDIECIPLVISI